jgi:methyltransferase (TIGR00027 family)
MYFLPMTPPDRTPEPLNAVSRTALAVAGVRARETRRPDRLFADPWAAAFLAAAGLPVERPAAASGPQSTALGRHTVLRIRHYDDALLAACADGARQVVLLAAGLDTRAFRLDWPAGTALYELDLPSVLAFKEGVLAADGARPRCRRTVVAADLAADDWTGRLRAAGHDPAAPTAWLVEGLLVYLTAEEAAGVLGALTDAAAPGSTLALERGIRWTGRPVEPSLARITSLWKGGLGPDTEDWLAARGWLTEYHPAEDLAIRHGRTGEQPLSTGFLTARRPA